MRAPVMKVQNGLNDESNVSSDSFKIKVLTAPYSPARNKTGSNAIALHTLLR